MSNADQSGADELNPRVLSPAKTPTRPPEPVASRRNEEPPYSTSNGPRPPNPAPAGRAMTPPRKPAAQTDKPTAFQRSLGAVRMALPVLQKMLPLLEGNVATVVSNMLAPPFQSAPAGFDAASKTLWARCTESLPTCAKAPLNRARF